MLSSYYIPRYVQNKISISLQINTDALKCPLFKQKAHFVNIPEQDKGWMNQFAEPNFNPLWNVTRLSQPMFALNICTRLSPVMPV